MQDNDNLLYSKSQDQDTYQLINESRKSRLTSSLLQLLVGFIGFLGLGRFYLGHIGLGLIQLLLSTVLFFTGLQALTFFLAVIDCVYVLSRSSLKDGKGNVIPFFSNNSERSRLVAALSQLFLGFFGLLGVGRLYLGHYKYGSVQLVISFILLMTGLLPITYILTFFDFIYVLCSKNMKDINGRKVPLLFKSSNSEQAEHIDYNQHDRILNNLETISPVEIVPTVSSNIIKVE